MQYDPFTYSNDGYRRRTKTGRFPFFVFRPVQPGLGNPLITTQYGSGRSRGRIQRCIIGDSRRPLIRSATMDRRSGTAGGARKRISRTPAPKTKAKSPLYYHKMMLLSRWVAEASRQAIQNPHNRELACQRVMPLPSLFPNRSTLSIRIGGQPAEPMSPLAVPSEREQRNPLISCSDHPSTGHQQTNSPGYSVKRAINLFSVED